MQAFAMPKAMERGARIPPARSPSLRASMRDAGNVVDGDGTAGRSEPATAARDVGDFSRIPVHGSHAAGRGPFVRVRAEGFTHPMARAMADPATRFRLPEFARVKEAYTDPTLKIPEAVIKTRVTQLLQRMAFEHRLKSSDPVATLVAKIFPGPGKIDQAEFEKAIDVADRSRIYRSVTDADTKVLAADKPKLQSAMTDAAADVKTVEGDATGLQQVFGAQAATAKANYGKARKVLENLGASATKLDAEVTTDYNLDDPEVGLGGWASFATKRMHLLLKVAQVADLAKTKAVVIHEASHFANASVDDNVYYGAPGFFEADEAVKVANAAHYEELPRRLSKISKFDKKTFKPGVMASGGTATREDNVKAAATNYLRKSWDASVDAHTLIRGVRVKNLAGDPAPFNRNKALLISLSKLMDLTIHEQASGHETVTTLDVTLSESVARGVAAVGSLAQTVPFPSPIGTLTDAELRDRIVAAAVVKYGNLLRDAARDKALLDWFESHYRKVPQP